MLLITMDEYGQDDSALLAMASALDVARRRCLRVISLRLVGQPKKPSQRGFISVKEAHARYPISRSFLYSTGEKEGIVTRPTGKKVVVSVEALERWLAGKRG